MARLFVSGNFTTVAGKMGKRRNDLRSQARGKNLQAARILEKMMRNSFQTNGASIGTSWASLRPSTAKRKRTAGLVSPVKLIRTGKMVRSLKSTATNIWGKVAFSMRKPYPHFHQRGTRHMAARELLPSKRVALDAIFPVFQKWVQVILNR